jgi:hypothetical protein
MRPIGQREGEVLVIVENGKAQHYDLLNGAHFRHLPAQRQFSAPRRGAGAPIYEQVFT